MNDNRKVAVGRISAEDEQKRLQTYGLHKQLSKMPPLPEVDGDAVIDENDPQFRDNIITVHPESLHELKVLVGIPDGAVAPGHGAKLHDVSHHVAHGALPKSGPFDPTALEEDDREAFQRIGYNLLMGPAHEDSLDEVSKAVASSLVKSAQGMKVTVGDDLVVKDGQTYTITTPSAQFNTITIYGSGSISFSVPDVKIITNSLTYVEQS